MKESLKKFAPIIVAVLAFVIISVGYFSPVLEGKKIFQNDIKHFIGMAKEVNDFRAENDEAEPYWTNGAFGGMPTYNLSAKYSHDYIKKLDKILRFLPRPADYLFLYLLSFFVLLLVLKVDVRLAFLGAVAFGFSTYFIIILGVGHNAKAHAIAYMPLVLAGILLVFRGKYLWGFVLTAIAMALEITASHPQMTYYLLIATIVLGITFFIEAIKKKELPAFFKQIAILVVAVVLAVGTNATGLLATKEYAKYSTRGKSELTINVDGSTKKASNGLSKEYITQYSYGKLETFNLFIPRFMGGGNSENVGLDSNIYKFLKKNVDARQAKQFAEHAPLYWGKQPIVEAPAYIGAALMFFFVLGVFLLKGKYRNWLLATFIVSIILSWGKNLSFVTNFFIDYVPLYNKFRAVSSIQVIAELVVPLLGVLALKEWFSSKIPSEEKLKALKISLLVTGGFALIFTLFGSSLFAFEGLRDDNYDQMLPGFLQAILLDREAVFFKDSLRTLIFVVISAAVLWLFLKEKLSKNIAIVCLISVVLIDLISVDRRYVNNNDFLSARKIDKPFVASEVDKQILQDKSIYRVANFSLDPMNDGSTSYFHKSIGGYHAAKMGRYQELYDYQIAKNNVEVLNMLNTKYFKFTNEQQKELAQQNTNANGNAWFVKKLKLVNSANEEMVALDSLKTKNEAVIDRSKLQNELTTSYKVDSTSVIKLTSYKTNELVYKSTSKENGFAVFSEIYYKDGWNAYVDGVLKPHYRVNYVLRGLEVSKGSHTIEFKFEPTIIKTGNTITLLSYLFLIFIPAGWYFVEKKAKKIS
ncbi:membrane protein YfhO [Lutibacter oricola]|uniref:Membrane protein YfhO n=1 Tax=Lutibacter oricola TaxID=762486 RepID=A0A1H3CB94_9FLAO|nr:YfhO family protein [Lutibacter oricola]SDX51310.1 membrane protein YfhO [Lutibacter oricola]